jgi:protein-glutamine gamma-glutamyltransferase
VPSVPTIFFLSIYGLTAIAGLMLAFAEGTPFPEILTPALAIIAYVLTDRTRKFALPVIWANGLGVAAFAYAVYQMFGETTTEMRLLAGAHLVVYLTWITLFQAKRLPQYWWMCALSVLQVAIGSILTISSSYGGMLLGFMFASIWTLAIFSLYQAHLQYGQSSAQWESTARTGLASRLAGGLQAVRRPAGNQARTLLMQRSTARSTMQLDPDERWLGARFVMSMLAVSFGALIVAAGFFLFIPRLWAGRDEWGANETRQFRSAALTGFTTEVKLGDMVPLLENPKRVLQVSLFNAEGLPIDLGRYCENLGYAEPLFRGATMEMYDHGTWSGTGRGPTNDSLPSAPESPSVRQQIVMEPLGTPILFAIEPFDSVRLPGRGEQVEWQPVTGQIFRPDSLASDKTIAYDVFSTQEGIRRREGSRTNPYDVFATQYFEQYRRVPDSVPKLAALARRLVKTAKLAANLDKPERARRKVEFLCGYLRDSGQYRYSLDASIHDPKIDPVEDFLFNRKAGHCEYFASALALMLRAVDVPARLVSGFKGGAINSISGAFEVEQRYAHVWVEAFIENEPEPGEPPSGYWIVADPTPAARDASVASFASGIGTAHDLASVVTSTWNRIISIDINAQESSLYVPLQSAITNWWNPPGGSRPFLALLVAGIVDFATDPTQWFTVTGLLVAASIAVISAGLLWLVRHRHRLWERFASLWKPRQTERQIRIAFYERFEALCRQLGLVRPRFQTQREFAGTVGPRIREVVQSPDGLPDFPPRLVDFFYRARFGEEELAPPVIDQLNRDMTALEEALKKTRRRPGTT